MAITPTVRINGSILSNLMFEHSNSNGEQEGFLLGNVTKYERSEISDTSICNKKEEIQINIFAIVPCESILSFYKANGCVSEIEVAEYVNGRSRDVVGWYRYRRHSGLQASLRETVVHRNLKRALLCEEPFVFGIFTNSASSNAATHNFDYGFFQQSSDSSFVPLLLNIINLGDTSHVEYRLRSHSSVHMDCESYSTVLTTAENFQSCWETEDLIQKVHYGMRTKLESLQEELGGSEAIVASLELEVSDLEAEMQTLLSLKGGE